MMTISEMKKRKRECEQKIQDLVETFTAETGCKVKFICSEVDVTTFASERSESKYNVIITVDL